ERRAARTRAPSSPCAGPVSAPTAPDYASVCVVSMTTVSGFFFSTTCSTTVGSCTTVLLAVSVRAAAPAAAAGPQPGAKPAYQRYCSLMAGSDPASRHYQTEMAKLPLPNDEQNVAIASAIRRAIQAQEHSAMLPPDVHIMFRDAQRLLVNPMGSDELVLVTAGS